VTSAAVTKMTAITANSLVVIISFIVLGACLIYLSIRSHCYVLNLGQFKKFKAGEKKRLLMTEDEAIKTALAHTDTIRLSIATIERLKNAAGNYPHTWDDVINRILDVYYNDEDKEKKKKRGGE
jgi:hypothetical protein